MASNSFGQIFRITTWGESHGKGVGVVIDGCPAGLAISEAEVNEALAQRAPGRIPLTSPRKESDQAEIYSGVFEGVTTGAPISIIIHNHDAKSSAYEPIKNILRPGHANFTYLEKYGVFDYRGGGRASARETACRVAAAAVAKKLLLHENISVKAYLASIAGVQNYEAMMQKVKEAMEAGDSLGGIVAFEATGLPVGLGDPVYEKLEANLAKAMLSLPATKGFEIGEGFQAAEMKGSEHNDIFIKNKSLVITQTNHSGGTLGGISTGMPLMGKVAFKPTSSIKKSQKTLDRDGNIINFTLPEGSRHDPCVAIRAVPVVEAMCSLVLADAILLNRCARV